MQTKDAAVAFQSVKKRVVPARFSVEKEHIVMESIVITALITVRSAVSMVIAPGACLEIRSVKMITNVIHALAILTVQMA